MGGGGVGVSSEKGEKREGICGERETFELIFIFSWYQVFLLGVNSRRMV